VAAEGQAETVHNLRRITVVMCTSFPKTFDALLQEAEANRSAIIPCSVTRLVAYSLLKAKRHSALERSFGFNELEEAATSYACTDELMNALLHALHRALHMPSCKANSKATFHFTIRCAIVPQGAPRFRRVRRYP